MSGSGSVWLAYNEAENARDFARMGSLVSTELRASMNGRAAVGSAKEDEIAMRALFETYPDYRREVLEVLESGDRAVARWRMLGEPAREGDSPLDVSGCSIVTVRDGVIVEAALYCDGGRLERLVSAAVTE